MDYSENTAKLVDQTYRNIIEEFAPCAKQLSVAGKTYLKSLQGMIGTSRQYTDALSRVAHLANKSTLKGSSDIGAALAQLVEINRELCAQQANIMKFMEFDLLEPIEIAADKDTKLVGKEQKRFQQMYKGRRENYIKCMSTLKKSKRKKSTDADKQIAQMRMMDEARHRLEEFCDVSLKEAVVEERSLYGTVLDRHCALSKQLFQYHVKGCELLDNNIPDWEHIAASRREFPESCHNTPLNDEKEIDVNGSFYEDPSTNGSLRSGIRVQKGLRREGDSRLSSGWKENYYSVDEEDEEVYARPIIRAKSEFQLPTSPPTSTSGSDTPPRRYSRLVEYNGDTKANHVRALYPYHANAGQEMNLEEGDIIELKESRRKSGWQFGENLTSKASGWFPVSYTEIIADGIGPAVLHSNRVASPRDMCSDTSKERVPKPPPLPSTMNSPRSKYGTLPNQTIESSEYGMPSKYPTRKLLPVTPPTVSLSQQRMRHHASHPDIAEAIKYDSFPRKTTNGRK